MQELSTSQKQLLEDLEDKFLMYNIVPEKSRKRIIDVESIKADKIREEKEYEEIFQYNKFFRVNLQKIMEKDLELIKPDLDDLGLFYEITEKRQEVSEVSSDHFVYNTDILIYNERYKQSADENTHLVIRYSVFEEEKRFDNINKAIHKITDYCISNPYEVNKDVDSKSISKYLNKKDIHNQIIKIYNAD